jgi:hypothetical protein
MNPPLLNPRLKPKVVRRCLAERHPRRHLATSARGSWSVLLIALRIVVRREICGVGLAALVDEGDDEDVVSA